MVGQKLKTSWPCFSISTSGSFLGLEQLILHLRINSSLNISVACSTQLCSSMPKCLSWCWPLLGTCPPEFYDIMHHCWPIHYMVVDLRSAAILSIERKFRVRFIVIVSSNWLFFNYKLIYIRETIFTTSMDDNVLSKTDFNTYVVILPTRSFDTVVGIYKHLIVALPDGTFALVVGSWFYTRLYQCVPWVGISWSVSFSTRVPTWSCVVVLSDGLMVSGLQIKSILSSSSSQSMTNKLENLRMKAYHKIKFKILL